MASSTVPFSSKRFRVERNGNTPFFGYTNQQESCHPQVISHILSLARSNLELPLRRHNFSVDSRDVDSSVHASSVVSLNHVASEDLSSSYTAVIRSLRSRESSCGPSVRSSISTEDGVLLLETELQTRREETELID